MGLANQQVIVSLGFQSLSSTYTVLRSTGVMNAAMDKNNHITWRTTTAVLEGERPETKYKWWNNSQPSVHNKAVSHSGQQMNMSVAAMMMVVMVAMLYHTAQSVSHPNNQLTRHPTIQPSIQRPHTLVSARGNLENFKTIHGLLCEQAIYSFYSACISSVSFAIASSSSSISFEIFYFQINIGKLFSRIRNIK